MRSETNLDAEGAPKVLASLWRPARPPILSFVLLAFSVLGCAAAGPAEESAPGPVGLPADVVSRPEPVAEYRRAEALFEAGEYDAAARAFLSLPAETVTEDAAGLVAGSVSRLGRHSVHLLASLGAPGSDDPRFGAVFAELALRYSLSGDPEEATRHAQAARATGARALDPVSARPAIGVILPLTGSPSNRDYAEHFLEGVQVAVAAARSAGVEVELLVRDNRGTAYGSEQAALALSARGVSAVLGPLLDDNLSAVARVLEPDIPLFSPTAQLQPDGRRGVYSLEAAGPEAARTLADAVSLLGYNNAVVVHPRRSAESIEAAAFLSAFREAGGFARRMDYPPGETTFREYLEPAAEHRPDLLVVLAPASDLVLLAPQIAFYGLDDLGIQVAGTAAWTTPQVLESVDRRHTDRVVAVSSTPPGASPPAGSSFRSAYEAHFRKSLRSPVPAAGFDLLRIALAVWAEGTRTGADLPAALRGVHSYSGLTGSYVLADGQLAREYFPVRIFDGTLRPVDEETVPAAGVLPSGSPSGSR